MWPTLRLLYSTPFPLMAPEDGGGSKGDGDDPGGDGNKAGGDGGGGTAGAGDEGGGGDAGSAPERPDWMPEKLWGDGSQFLGENGNLDREAMAKALSESYRQAENKIFTRKDDLKKEVRDELTAEQREGVPESPDKYAINTPDLDLPTGEKLQLDTENPAWQQLKQFAHDNGMSQKQLDGLINLYAEQQVAQFPDFDTEAGKLGENGQERIERAATWAEKHLSEQAFETVKAYAVNAEFVQAFEELMELAGEPRFSIDGEGNVADAVTRDDLKKIMASKEYRDGDPATVQKVRSGFKKISQAETKGARR